MKKELIVTLICTMFFTISCSSSNNLVSVNNKMETPEQQMKNHSGWGLPTYLKPYPEMVRRLEDNSRADWQMTDKIISTMGNLKNKVVYDLGAGTGYFVFKILEKKPKTIIAADPDPRFLSYLLGKRDALKISNEKIKVRPIPYTDPLLKVKEVDVVLSVNTYHMISNRVEYLKKVKKGLKKNGKILIVNFKKISSRNGPPIHKRLTEKDTTSELEQAGFKVIQTDNSLPINYIIVGKKI